MPKKSFDNIWLIDRYPASPARGEQVMPFAFLHPEPGPHAPSEMTGALAHNARVEVEDGREHDGVMWYLVNKYAGERLQRGWLSVVFLKRRGAEYFEQLG